MADAFTVLPSGCTTDQQKHVAFEAAQGVSPGAIVSGWQKHPGETPCPCSRTRSRLESNTPAPTPSPKDGQAV